MIFTEIKRIAEQKVIYKGLAKLSNKVIPYEYKFDHNGSQIFELLRQSPYYPMGKAGEQIAHRSAGDIANILGPRCHLVDMGCGMGKVSRIYAEQLLPESTVYPVDISKIAVDYCVNSLHRIPTIKIGISRPLDFLHGLDSAVRNRKPGETICAALFGGTIANFTRVDAHIFLKKVRTQLVKGDYFMLATDMEKPKHIIEEAYNDPLLLAASWNLNTLAHINTVFTPWNTGKKESMQTPFNVRDFQHKAKYFDSHDAPNNQHLAMYVVAKKDVTINIPYMGTISIKKDEEIQTYESHRFTDEQIKNIAATTGFEIIRFDESNPDWRFCHTLLRVA
jgi:uncharacterized SAM-dependent methyltransferase